MENYLEENPSESIYKRKVKQRIYYYKKYRKHGKSVSEYLGPGKSDIDKLLKELKAKNLKRFKIKENCQKLKKINTALEKQLEIARKAYAND